METNMTYLPVIASPVCMLDGTRYVKNYFKVEAGAKQVPF
jgi:hypothetical protein